MSVYHVLVVDEFGKELERFPTAISPIGAGSFTTKKGFYVVKETAIDYTTNEIVVHTEEYDIF